MKGTAPKISGRSPILPVLPTLMAGQPALDSMLGARRQGWSLEQPFYTEEAILKADMERVIRHQWMYAGHVSRIPLPGDYFLYQVGTDSLIIIRGETGEVKALFNCCRHRGSVVCNKPEGHAKALVCPYHQWVYETDGSLRTAKHMAEDFDKSCFGLETASVNVLEGFIFVCLSKDAPDFTPLVRDGLAAMKPHEFAKAKPCFTKSYEVKANWKLVVENFRECYHCGAGHPEYCRAVISAIALDSPSHAVEEKLINAETELRWKALGLPLETVWFQPDTWHLVWRFPLSRGFLSQSLDGKPVSLLMGKLPERDLGVQAITTCPNFWLEASSDYFVTIRLTPVAAALTEIEMQWFVHPDAVEGKDFEVDKVLGVWKATAEQDFKLCEDNQAGVESSRYKPGPYSEAEGGTETFIQWYVNEMSKERVGAGHRPALPRETKEP